MAMTYFRNLFFQTDDGITLYVRDYPGPSPDAPVVLCLHGLSRNSRDFEDLAPHLQTTHRVLVPDQRGRGRSEHDPVSERYLPQNYVGDMLALLDALGGGSGTSELPRRSVMESMLYYVSISFRAKRLFIILRKMAAKSNNTIH